MRLGKTNAVPNVAVKNLQAARRFYEGTLELEPIETDGEELVAYRAGDTALNVYRSEFAGTNKATAVTWVVGDELEDTVNALKSKGVRFEHYDDMPGIKRKGDIHQGGDMKVAWFKDPDGNILNLVNR